MTSALLLITRGWQTILEEKFMNVLLTVSLKCALSSGPFSHGFTGYGAVLSFETGDKELSERIVGATRLWGISVSFGCVNSLISMPCVMSLVDYRLSHDFITDALTDTPPSTLPHVQSEVFLRT